MKKALFTSLVVLLCLSSFAQKNIRDSIFKIAMFSAEFTYQIPMGDMKDRFGNNSRIGGSFMFKTSKNWMMGIRGGMIYSDKVKETGMFDNLMTVNGKFLGTEGHETNIFTAERGYMFMAEFGKLIPVFSSNKNSGIVTLFGLGFLEHKIKIIDRLKDYPQLSGDLVKGYDRLSNGAAISQYIGYQYMGNTRLVNFYGGVEVVEAFTKNRRTLNYDTGLKDNSSRIDILLGIKIGWIIPLYKKRVQEFYYY